MGTENQSVIKIGSALTIHQVTQSYQDWALARKSESICIDASETKEVDAAGLQLLFYTINCIHINNGTVNWQPKPSEYFYNQVQLAGMMSGLLLNQGESK